MTKHTLSQDSIDEGRTLVRILLSPFVSDSSWVCIDHSEKEQKTAKVCIDHSEKEQKTAKNKERPEGICPPRRSCVFEMRGVHDLDVVARRDVRNSFTKREGVQAGYVPRGP
jgi:hypothetical protein